ncbi:MAG: HAMP domain-containing histidine kinase [Thaumarchaeota archaeon]|nr:MAG: HAMP domain-containing histidine kinase [Nitrososphaerota archaeon]
MDNLDKAREELVALFSHELKTPLTLVVGWCQVLQDYKIIGRLNAEQKNAVDVISANSTILRNEIENILDTKKLIYGTMLFSFRKIELNKLIQRIIKRLKPVTEERKIRVVNLATKRIILRTDEDRLEQVLSNLIMNAIDFVPRKTGVIKVGTREEDREITFYVKDNGKGISKKIHRQIFEKLFQEDSSYRRKHTGLGLGLFLCKGIVENLGGRIWVDSKLRKGSIFYFTHPKKVKLRRFSLRRRKQ